MIKKQLLIEFLSDEKTVWLIGGKNSSLQTVLEIVIGSAVASWTRGPVPAVKVMALEPEFEVSALQTLQTLANIK